MKNNEQIDEISENFDYSDNRFFPVDDVLDKISEFGLESLNEDDKRILSGECLMNLRHNLFDDIDHHEFVRKANESIDAENKMIENMEEDSRIQYFLHDYLRHSKKYHHENLYERLLVALELKKISLKNNGNS